MKIILSVLLVLLLGLSLFLDVDKAAMEIQNESFDRAMIAFGLAKGLNAVISLLQGTELSFTPVGVGLNFSVGEVLDPFNDMVERFSWVMLFVFATPAFKCSFFHLCIANILYDNTRKRV